MKVDALRPRLWVVSELYYPEQTSTGYFLTRIAEGLADSFDVSIICGQPSYSERGIKAPRFEERHGTRIHRVRATHFDKDRLLLRAINMLTLTIAIGWFALMHFRRGDRLLVVTNPPSVPMVTGLAARWRGVRSALLVHDVYPELLAATGLLTPQSLAYRLLAGLFGWAYRLFADIVVLGEDMAEIVSAKLGAASRPIHIIPNWGDADEVVPIAREANAFRREHDLDGKFVVQFSGNIGRTHDIELLLGAARLLRDVPDILFLFVGYGGKTGLLSDAGNAELANVRFLPRQPREKLGQMLAASDVTVISFIDGMYGISVPSRMYNVMSAGVPIIASAEPRSALARTVAGLGAGWVLEERNAEGLAALIRSLATTDGLAQTRQRGAAGRAGVEAHYVLPVILDQYRALFANRPKQP
ncbi:glycosyltransferase family 4 protein [Sphingomonas sp.]|uniref:glycosyltransferase family 4 protein n=1 Tax=Sphingomonas sp. TaxID=28214 RepID=UPI001D42AC37|nr:glycosyltransferase family 4 protein [Sphingomonas sp.]MBX9796724.1 glycosyltransferase family 4 protein [Sphingomonas sp.]